MEEVRADLPDLAHIVYLDPRGLRSYDHAAMTRLTGLQAAGRARRDEQFGFIRQEIERPTAAWGTSPQGSRRYRTASGRDSSGRSRSMGETANLGLALLEPAQAQKHVTVNEALVRLDALAKGVLASRTVTEPPVARAEGAVWAVPEGAGGDWAGEAGRLAIATGGGWSFVTPREGWRAYVLDEGAALLHDGTRWTPEVTAPVASAPSGAETRIEVIEHRASALAAAR